MSEEEIVLVGVGMMTAVGLTAAETAASARAGTMRFSEINIHDKRFQPFTMAAVPEDGLPELAVSLREEPRLTHREARLLRLGALPLRECLAPIGERGIRPGLILALPDRETTRALDRKQFLQRFLVQAGGGFDLALSDASHPGRAGGLFALEHAARFIRAGHTSFMIAGGIETQRDPYVLATFDAEQRIKSSTQLDGFIPGEAAAFLLLASRSAALAAGLPPLTVLSPVSLAFEPGHLYSEEPYRGEGLSTALKQLVASGAVSAPIREVYSSLNGEAHWGKEWGVGYLRARAVFSPEHGMHHPADSVGETGAACGPLLVGLASLGIRSRYRSSPCLVYCSSDNGPRAALTVTAA